MNEERTLEVEIEPGVRDGMEYPFIGEGMCMGTALLLSFDLLLSCHAELVCVAKYPSPAFCKWSAHVVLSGVSSVCY